jgi:selenocysteine lyase/cysteine desulfurase
MPHPEFPLEPDLIYLNHAAVAPWPKRTAKAVSHFAEENSRYGSSFYLKWLETEKNLRKQLAQLLNAPSTADIALVKNTSEALSFVAYGLDWKAGDTIVSSNQEFPSNRVVWQSLANQGVTFKEADLLNASSPEQALFDQVDNHTRLLTISSIQFASGIRLDLEKIGRFCQDKGILLCIDAIQSLGCVQFDVQRYQADFVMADGHKWLLAPEGLGVFYSRKSARDQLKLTQYGWHMLADIQNYDNKPWKIHPTAKRFECGSPNMLGIHAFSASLSLLLETDMETVQQAVFERVDFLIQRLQQSRPLQLLSPANAELKSGIVIFRHRQIDNQRLFKHLSDHQVACAIRGGGIRFSPHFYNTLEELEQAVSIAEAAL